MPWVFARCPDKVGYCIRQYTFLLASCLSFSIAAYSILMTYRKLHQSKFQLLPLIINGVASLYILIASLQQQQESTYLIMFVVQVYSYSLLAYTYSGLYLRGNRVSTKAFRILRLCFSLFSAFVGLTIIGLIVLEFLKKIQCKNNLGLGNLILSISEIPIYIVTFIFIFKTKRRIGELERQKGDNESGELLGHEDAYITIKYQQANLAIASFTLSIIIHILTVILFHIDQFSCTDNSYVCKKPIEVVLLSLFDLGTLLPHLIMPFIFYFIPARYHSGDDVVLVTPKFVNKNTSYNSFGASSNIESEEKLRRHLLQHQHRSP